VTRRSLLPAAGLVAIALVTALAVVIASSVGGGGEAASPALKPIVDPGTAPPAASRLPKDGIAAEGSLLPGITLFGDVIVAQVDVVLDRTRVDPDSVRIGTGFLPWEVVGQPSRVRSDAGRTTYLRTRYKLRCTGSPCAPANQSTELDFDPTRVSYAAPGAAPGDRGAVRVRWPRLLVYSRFAAVNLGGADQAGGDNPWRADFLTFPAASYRIAPGVLVPALVLVALLLGAAGVVLAWVAIPRRQKEPEREPEPEPEPVIVLTPLEQALELLEDAERADGTEERRRALELVAEVLDLEHPELARAARTLAWSEDDPEVEQTSGLAVRVRGTIDTNGNRRAQ
jgi:hypothetical protein